jgi:hypothetical protein
MDPDSDPVPNPALDPALFVSFKMSAIFANSFLKVHLHHSSEIKGHKEVTKQQKFFLLSA